MGEPGPHGVDQALLPTTLVSNPKILIWSAVMVFAFQQVIMTLSTAMPLSHDAPGAIYSFAKDASGTHFGGL